MATRARAAASACLVASGLLISGAGGAIALADPGQGHSRQDDRKGSDDRRGPDSHPRDDSVGDIVRRAFGVDDGEHASNLWQRPDTRWGNGRWNGPGEGEPTRTDTPSSGTKTPPSEPCLPTEPPKPTEPTKPSEPPGEPEPTPPQSFPGGGGGAVIDLPRYKPPQVPDMQMPGELPPAPPGLPGEPAVIDAGGGVVAGAAPIGAAMPIALPVIVAPGVGVAGGAGSGGSGGSAGLPPAPRGLPSQPPAGRNPQPANVGSNAAVPNASYRIGYNEYLRTAALPQVAALAVPGLVGILVLTGAGGLVGYRQAKAGHVVHVGGSARFMG